MMLSRRNPMKDLASRMHASLAPLGFRFQCKKSRFYLIRQAGAVIAELQRSSKSTADVLVVTANVGLWNATVAEKLGGPIEPNHISAMDCPWWIRAGQLSTDREHWWTVGNTDNVAAVSADIETCFLLPAVDLLSPLTVDSKLLEYLRSSQPPFLDPMNRWAFVLALAPGVDDADARVAASELEKIGQSRTLPIGHRILLRSTVA